MPESRATLLVVRRVGCKNARGDARPAPAWWRLSCLWRRRRGYMEESKASEAVKAQSKKVEAEMEAKAKRE